MGSSARRKKEKKKDFQKTKLKVGKAKPKPANFTNTSFKSKGIVLKEQSIHTSTPSLRAQFSHYLSLLTSRSDAQRRDALGFLHNTLASDLPEPAAVFLPKLLPLTLDGNPGVRSQLLKVLASLSAADLEGCAEIILPYVRAGMTHLAPDIRASALDTLAWALDALGREVVSCAGGWVKTLKSFMAVLGWATVDQEMGNIWTTSKASFGRLGSEGKPMVKCLTVLAAFLRVGLVEPHEAESREGSRSAFPLWHVQQHTIPKHANCFGYLGIFGSSKEEDYEIYEDFEARNRIFNARFRRAVDNGLAAAKGEGGEVGRAAALGAKVVRASTVSSTGAFET